MGRGSDGRFQGASREEADLFLELLCWLMAVLILPVFLGLRGAPLIAFLQFASGASILLAFGSLVTGMVRGIAESAQILLCAFAGIVIVGAAPFGLALMMVALVT